MLYGILAFFFILILTYSIIIFNRLISLKNRADNAWAQIDVNLKLRNDLIPKLESVAKDYSDYEKKAFKEISEMRAKINNSRSVSKKYELSQKMNLKIREILIVSENYPKLKANKAFLKLQEALTLAESNIAFKRQFYNDVVYKYNVLLTSFPSIIIGKIFNFKMKESFSEKGE